MARSQGSRVRWLVLVAAGCAGSPPVRESVVPVVRATGAQQLAVDLTTADEFMAMVDRSRAGGAAAIDRLVALFPDLALAASASGSALAPTIAASYDRVVAGGHGELRRRVQGEFARHPPARMLQQLAREAAANGALHLALVVGVAACSAQGSTSATEAMAWWREAMALAWPTADPVGWRELLELRPPGADWPDAGPATEAVVHVRIAGWHLDRGETDAAAVAAARGEALSRDETRLAARLIRARALALLGKRGEALVLLDLLTTAAAPALRAESLALAGAVRGQLDDLAEAIRLLTQATHGPADWHGRGRALSDLGVALLRDGQETPGLLALHQAQEQCTAEGDHPGLVRALRNEAAWLTHRDQPSAALALEQRASRVIAQQGLLLAIGSTRSGR